MNKNLNGIFREHLMPRYFCSFFQMTLLSNICIFQCSQTNTSIESIQRMYKNNLHKKWWKWNGAIVNWFWICITFNQNIFAWERAIKTHSKVLFFPLMLEKVVHLSIHLWRKKISHFFWFWWDMCLSRSKMNRQNWEPKTFQPSNESI